MLQKKKEYQISKEKKKRLSKFFFLPCIIFPTLVAAMAYANQEKECGSIQKQIKENHDYLDRQLDQLKANQGQMQSNLADIRGLIETYAQLRPEEQAKILEFIEFCKSKRD